jgi:DNA-binding NarL/FixJ family response regulator
MEKKIVIANDHELFAAGLEKLIRSNSEYLVVERFKNGKEVMEFFQESSRVDLLVLELNILKMDGIQLLGHLHRRHPYVKVLVVSMDHSHSTSELVRKFGAKGFIGNRSTVSELLTAIFEVLKGNEYFIEHELEFKSIKNPYQFGGFFNQFGLSKREEDIIHLIINQYEGREIANVLNLSPLTVKTHRKNIFRKLGVRNLAGLVALVKDHPRL